MRDLSGSDGVRPNELGARPIVLCKQDIPRTQTKNEQSTQTRGLKPSFPPLGTPGAGGGDGKGRQPCREYSGDSSELSQTVTLVGACTGQPHCRKGEEREPDVASRGREERRDSDRDERNRCTVKKKQTPLGNYKLVTMTPQDHEHTLEELPLSSCGRWHRNAVKSVN